MLRDHVLQRVRENQKDAKLLVVHVCQEHGRLVDHECWVDANQEARALLVDANLVDHADPVVRAVRMDHAEHADPVVARVGPAVREVQEDRVEQVGENAAPRTEHPDEEPVDRDAEADRVDPAVEYVSHQADQAVVVRAAQRLVVHAEADHVAADHVAAVREVVAL